jgi:hypothetical protein
MTTDHTFIADRIARERQIDLYASAQAIRTRTPHRRWISGFRGR